MIWLKFRGSCSMVCGYSAADGCRMIDHSIQILTITKLYKDHLSESNFKYKTSHKKNMFWSSCHLVLSKHKVLLKVREIYQCLENHVQTNSLIVWTRSPTNGQKSNLEKKHVPIKIVIFAQYHTAFSHRKTSSFSQNGFLRFLFLINKY